jgi:predicted SAM-dependent methyltransferase
MALRINVGCGQTPTPNWRNFDNSLSLRLSRIPFLPELLVKFKLMNSYQYQLANCARKYNIEYGDVTKCLPLQDGSVDVIYCSHMIEHLDRNEVASFLKEAFRILRHGGRIRIVVPDLMKQIEEYKKSGDADVLIESTHLCELRPRSLLQRLRILLVGTRNHQWMYDGNSLSRLLQTHGFVKTEVMPAGQTKILAHEPLDLQERVAESVYVEAEKPIA